MKHLWMQTMSVFREIGLVETELKIIGNKFWFLLGMIKNLIKVSEIERKRILDDLSSKVMMKIQQLQNPRDCMDTQLLICKINTEISCGFGCETHSLIGCIMRTLRSQRTLIYISKGWKYAKHGREYAFVPLNNCSTRSSTESYDTAEDTGNATIIKTDSNAFQ
ncbi:alpha-(1,6)-fucosyltransferase-like [Styela clava]